MTHEEARLMLPAYALGALDRDVPDLEAHIEHCRLCQAELSDYLETTTAMGEAVEVVAPPIALRRAVLASVPERHGLRQRISEFLAPANRSALAIAIAAIVVVLALGAVVVQQRQLEAERSELALNSRGLELLTSTEVITERLAPVFDPTSQAHGHWYHRPSVTTQVIVVEFLPRPLPGQNYFAWLQHADGSWTSPGPFSLDQNGYGRLIILGSDGTDVRAVVVTRQSGPTPSPTGDVILRWPAS